MTLVLGTNIYLEKCSYKVVVPLVLRLRLRVSRRTLLAALHTAQTARLSALVQVVDVERVAPTVPNKQAADVLAEEAATRALRLHVCASPQLFAPHESLVARSVSLLCPRRSTPRQCTSQSQSKFPAARWRAPVSS